MSTQVPEVKRPLKIYLFIVALILANISINTITYFQNIVLVDVAKTFKVSVGTMAPLGTVGLSTGLIIGLGMGFLAVRFKHKSLLLLGVASYAVGALVYFFAPNYATLFLTNVFTGIGGTMVFIMAFTLIGDVLPLQERGLAIGLVGASTFLTNLVTAPITGLIAPAAGWHAVLLWFVFPVSVVSLLFCFLIIPSKSREEQVFVKPEYLKAFKQILTNKSAIACVIGAVLLGLNSALLSYAVTFFRMFFSVSLSAGAIFGLLASTSGFCGGLAAARLINRVGRWRLAITAALFAGILHISFTYVPNDFVSLAFWMGATVFVGLYAASFISLALEQVPGFRGTMMSLFGSLRTLGIMIGISIAGLLLNLYANNFHMIMVMFGGAAVTLALILLLFAKDPAKNQISPTV